MRRKAGTGVGTLYFTLMLLTVGLLLLIIGMAFSSAHTAYNALSSAAQEAAWSGQAQIKITSVNNGGNQGYFDAGLVNGEVSAAVQQTWQANIQSMALTHVFSNLKAADVIQNNQVLVTASGDFPVPFLTQALGMVFNGKYAQAFTIPMQVTAQGAST